MVRKSSTKSPSWLSGRAAERELLANLSHAGVDAVVAGVVLWYHWYLVLRADLAALRKLVDTRVGVAVIGGLDRAAADRLDVFVRTSLDGTRTGSTGPIRSIHRRRSRKPYTSADWDWRLPTARPYRVGRIHSAHRGGLIEAYSVSPSLRDFLRTLRTTRRTSSTSARIAETTTPMPRPNSTTSNTSRARSSLTARVEVEQEHNIQPVPREQGSATLTPASLR